MPARGRHVDDSVHLGYALYRASDLWRRSCRASPDPGDLTAREFEIARVMSRRIGRRSFNQPSSVNAFKIENCVSTALNKELNSFRWKALGEAVQVRMGLRSDARPPED